MFAPWFTCAESWCLTIWSSMILPQVVNFNQVHNLLFLTNPPLFGHSWSLALEISNPSSKIYTSSSIDS